MTTRSTRGRLPATGSRCGARPGAWPRATTTSRRCSRALPPRRSRRCGSGWRPLELLMRVPGQTNGATKEGGSGGMGSRRPRKTLLRRGVRRVPDQDHGRQRRATTSASPTRYIAYGASDRSRSTWRISHVEASVEAKADAAPAANAPCSCGRTPRRSSRVPFSTVAPRMIGRATWRESALASSRVNRRARAAASVAPLRETPGISAHAWATPSRSASSAPASSRPRRCGARSATSIATDPRASPAAIVAGVPRRCSIGRSKRLPITAGGANDSATSWARRRLTPGISCRSATSSAAAVPACSATSNALRSSPSSSVYGHPRSQGTSVMCADDETGRSSAGPCSAPSAIEWRRGSGSAGGDIGRRLGLPASPPPAHDEVDDADDDGGEHRVVDVPEGILPLVPAIAHLVADEREHEHPRDAAEERVEREAPERHPGHAGGQRNEGAHDWQHAAEEDRPAAPALEPAVGAVEARLADVQPFAVLLDQLDPPEVAHGVGDPRADEVAQHAGRRHLEERELAPMDV